MQQFLAKVKAKFLAQLLAIQMALSFGKLLAAKRSGMTLSVGMVISIFLVFIVGAAVLPTAFSQWFNASTTGWPTATQTLWPLVPLLGIVVIIAILAYRVSESHGKV